MIKVKLDNLKIAWTKDGEENNKKGTKKHKLKKEAYQGNKKESHYRRNGFKLTFFKSKLKPTCQGKGRKTIITQRKIINDI